VPNGQGQAGFVKCRVFETTIKVDGGENFVVSNHYSRRQDEGDKPEQMVNVKTAASHLRAGARGRAF
jgi:hypothetical protein